MGTESFLAFKDGLIKRFFPNPHLKALFETGTIPKFDENVDQLSEDIAVLEFNSKLLNDALGLGSLEQFQIFITSYLPELIGEIPEPTSRTRGQKGASAEDGTEKILINQTVRKQSPTQHASQGIPNE